MSQILDFLDNHIIMQLIIITILAFTILGIVLNIQIAKLYKVQAEIVIHDYGHIYEDINDWKLEKIEKFEKENKNV